ncbi:hypothetical protein [Mucilaginibacter dorajii]|nr:hypothetical protein [Mucilaginibacter dorajii]MCS3737138.1 hypothetical protein [Mucilaginibacter dorajii]
MSKTTALNEQFDAKFKVDVAVLTEIMTCVEAKFHKCEMIYNAYFEYIDHAVLAGNAASLPVQMNCTFTDGTASFQEIITCDDKAFYRDLIDTNFQTFILMVASIYENLVHVTEIISKKVIVYMKKKPPISAPLHDFLEHLKLLVNLGYRKTNELDTCLTTFAPYFQTYLLTTNRLRNSFIHGYARNLASDGFNYRITNFDPAAFTAGSPQLNIDLFSKNILDNTRDFIAALYPALEKTIRHHTKRVPV